MYFDYSICTAHTQRGGGAKEAVGSFVPPPYKHRLICKRIIMRVGSRRRQTDYELARPLGPMTRSGGLQIHINLVELTYDNSKFLS